jgi:hypothetical protein
MLITLFDKNLLSNKLEKIWYAYASKSKIQRKRKYFF